MVFFQKWEVEGYLPFLQGRDSLSSSIDTFLPAHDLITKLEYEGDEQRMDALLQRLRGRKTLSNIFYTS